jgi:hypothetical protein
MYSEELLSKLTDPFLYEPSHGQIIGKYDGAHFLQSDKEKVLISEDIKSPYS